MRKRVRHTTPEIDAAARRLRRRMTEAEEVLWRALRREQVGGLHFRRQHPVMRFVLDFFCPAERLCIEVDGPVHIGREEVDAARTAALETKGIRVLRFRNEEVLEDLPSVLHRIEVAVEQGRRDRP